MKKKMMVLITICMVCLFCCACGSSESSESTDNTTPSTNTQNNSDVIELGDVTVAENDIVTVQASQFYKKEDQSFVIFKVKNKYDGEITFGVNNGDAYIGDESVILSSYDGNTGPLPGKIKQFTYVVFKNSGGEDVSIDPLDELYRLNGKFNVVAFYKDGSGWDDYDCMFDLSSLK